MTRKAWEPDFSALTKNELFEVDRKVDEEVSKIDLTEWAVRLLTVGALWALWEKLGKPVQKNLSTLADVLVRKDHAFGKVAPGGALARVENISDVLPFDKMGRNALKFATLHAGEHLQQISDKTRTAVRLALIQAKQQGTHPKELAAQLRATFKGLDRDWKRVAITESASIALNGYVMSQGEGQLVMGQSAPDACEWCADMIHGKIFTVTHTPPSSLTDPRWDTHIWVGKTNVGRVRHARAKGGRVRVSQELWKPGIPMHPHCRCRLVAYNPRFHEVGADGFMRLK